jgi:MFS family permease
MMTLLIVLVLPQQVSYNCRSISPGEGAGRHELMPTDTTYVGNLAPKDMRRRYMSIFGLTWGVAQGIGPVMGGLLSDNIGPSAPWLGGGMVGVLAVTAFVLLARRARTPAKEFAALTWNTIRKTDQTQMAVG